MRSSEDDDEECCYPPGYYTGVQTQLTSHTAMSYPYGQGTPTQPPNMQSSSSRSSMGSYHSGMWAPATQGSGYISHGTQYARQDHISYAPQHQAPGYNSGPGGTYREQDHWSPGSSGPSGGHGRYGVDYIESPSSHDASSSWNPHSSHSTSFMQQGPSTSQHHTSEVHAYVALPSTPQSTIESYLTPIKLPATTSTTSAPKRAYQCTWPDCPKAARGEIFKSKDNARVHVHKHFGSEKLFQCVIPSCGKQFASEDAAKRHRDTTESKAYSCGVCYKEFARKDYRDVHQRRCAD